MMKVEMINIVKDELRRHSEILKKVINQEENPVIKEKISIALQFHETAQSKFNDSFYRWDSIYNNLRSGGYDRIPSELEQHRRIIQDLAYELDKIKVADECDSLSRMRNAYRYVLSTYLFEELNSYFRNQPSTKDYDYVANLIKKYIDDLIPSYRDF